jgi:hypothetical protein
MEKFKVRGVRQKSRKDWRAREAANLKERKPFKTSVWAAGTQLDMNSLSVSWEPPVIRSASRSIAVIDVDYGRPEKLIGSDFPNDKHMLSKSRFMSISSLADAAGTARDVAAVCVVQILDRVS